jgi:hypothetical protein
MNDENLIHEFLVSIGCLWDDRRIRFDEHYFSNQSLSDVFRKIRRGVDPNLAIVMPPAIRIELGGISVLPVVTMTPLEFAVMGRHWQMFLVLFGGGANINMNLFNGIINDSDETHMIDAFRNENGEFKPISGFQGLRCILASVPRFFPPTAIHGRPVEIEAESKMRSALWLAECSVQPAPSTFSNGHFETVRTHVLTLDEGYEWDRIVVDPARTAFLSVRRATSGIDVPSDLLLAIHDFWLPGYVVEAAKDFLASIPEKFLE